MWPAALLLAGVSSSCALRLVLCLREEARTRGAAMRRACCREAVAKSGERGVAAVVVDLLVRNTLRARSAGGRMPLLASLASDGRGHGPSGGVSDGLWGRWMTRASSLVVRAGLSGQASAEGLALTSLDAMGFFAACLGSMGLVVSAQLGAACLFLGAAVGATLPARVLKRAAQTRNERMIGELPGFIEALCVGLRSGMSFDGSLRVYCDHFDGDLARQMDEARRTWEFGLMMREEALRRVAGGYDSPVLSHVVECIVRSLRFGAPLADGLSELSVQARSERKARVKEKVMKVPVKMMVPVGTMLLPAMLILVMGPVLLSLADQL